MLGGAVEPHVVQQPCFSLKDQSAEENISTAEHESLDKGEEEEVSRQLPHS